MQRLTSFFSFIGRIIHVEAEIQIESADTFAVSAQITVEMADAITEAQAPCVWSSFWNCAIAVDDLIFSHVDTDGIAGYRINGTSRMVWRNELHPVALA